MDLGMSSHLLQRCGDPGRFPRRTNSLTCSKCSVPHFPEKKCSSCKCNIHILLSFWLTLKVCVSCYIRTDGIYRISWPRQLGPYSLKKYCLVPKLELLTARFKAFLSRALLCVTQPYSKGCFSLFCYLLGKCFCCCWVLLVYFALFVSNGRSLNVQYLFSRSGYFSGHQTAPPQTMAAIL